MIPMIAIALVALVFFAGYGVMSDTGVEENGALENETVAVELAEPATSEPGEATSEKADAEYAKLMERSAEYTEKYSKPLESDAQVPQMHEEMRQLREDCLLFYQTYGWDKYDDFVYHDREALLKSAEESIDVQGDFIYMVENDLMPLGEGETKEGMIALYEKRIDMYKDFMEKVKASGDDDLRALSGEFEYRYDIHEKAAE